MCFICVVCSNLLQESPDGNDVPPCKIARLNINSGGSDGSDDEDYVVVTKCGHLFHNSCLTKVIYKVKGNSSCPKCHQNLTTNNLQRIYPELDKNKGKEAENQKLKDAIISQQLHISQVESQAKSMSQAAEQLKQEHTELQAENNNLKEKAAESKHALSKQKDKTNEAWLRVTELDTKNSKLVEELKAKNQQLELQALKLQQNESEAQLFTNAQILHDYFDIYINSLKGLIPFHGQQSNPTRQTFEHMKIYMEKLEDFIGFHKEHEEKLLEIVRRLGVDLKLMEEAECLKLFMQTVVNLKPEDKKALQMDIRGTYELIHSDKFKEYLEAIGNSPGGGTDTETETQRGCVLVKIPEPNIYGFISCYNRGRHSGLTCTMLFGPLGEIFDGTQEGCCDTSGRKCKTLITKKSQTELVQQQIYKGKICVTTRRFTSNQMHVTLVGPGGGVTCTLIYDKVNSDS